MKNFPDVALSLSPDELMSPWFVYFPAFIGNGLHRLGATITDFSPEGITIAIVRLAQQLSRAAGRSRSVVLMMWKAPRATVEWNLPKTIRDDHHCPILLRANESLIVYPLSGADVFPPIAEAPFPKEHGLLVSGPGLS
jgi:hypothetical protein